MYIANQPPYTWFSLTIIHVEGPDSQPDGKYLINLRLLFLPELEHNLIVHFCQQNIRTNVIYLFLTKHHLQLCTQIFVLNRGSGFHSFLAFSKTANDRCRPHSTSSFTDALPAFSILKSASCLEVIPAMVLQVRRTLKSRTDEDSTNRDFKIFIFVLLNFECTVNRSIYSLRVSGMFSRPVSGNRFAQIFSFKLI